MNDALLAFWRDEDGADLIEWVIVAAFLVGIVAAAMALFGPFLNDRARNLLD